MILSNKQSSTLVTLYLDSITREEMLAACLHSIAVQTKPVDLAIFAYGLSPEQLTIVESLVAKPYRPIPKKGEDGKIALENAYTDNVLNATIVPVDKPMKFSTFFNETLDLANTNGYETFSVCEQEDAYSVVQQNIISPPGADPNLPQPANFVSNWFKVADTYKNEKPAAGVILSLIKNSSSGQFTRISNEIAFVENMVEEVGSVDVAILMRMNCINPLGALYVTDKIKQWALKKSPKSTEEPDGKLRVMKESMTISHYYEAFLRLVYNDMKIVAVPRIGYECNGVPKNSFNDSSCKIPDNLGNMLPGDGGITQHEGSFWMELAKKEYFFSYDRYIPYQPPAPKQPTNLSQPPQQIPVTA